MADFSALETWPILSHPSDTGISQQGRLTTSYQGEDLLPHQQLLKLRGHEGPDTEQKPGALGPSILPEPLPARAPSSSHLCRLHLVPHLHCPKSDLSRRPAPQVESYCPQRTCPRCTGGHLWPGSSHPSLSSTLQLMPGCSQVQPPGTPGVLGDHLLGLQNSRAVPTPCSTSTRCRAPCPPCPPALHPRLYHHLSTTCSAPHPWPWPLVPPGPPAWTCRPARPDDPDLAFSTWGLRRG